MSSKYHEYSDPVSHCDSRSKWLIMILSRLVSTVGTSVAKIVVSASSSVEVPLVEDFTKALLYAG